MLRQHVAGKGAGGGWPELRPERPVTQQTYPSPPDGLMKPQSSSQHRPTTTDAGLELWAHCRLPQNAAKPAAWSYHASSSDGRSLAPRSNRGTTNFAQRKRACEPHRAGARKTGKLGQPVPPASFFCKQAQAQAQGPPMRRLATSKHASLQHCLLPATALHQQPGPRQMELLLLRAPSAPLPPKLQLATRVAAVTAATRHAAPAPAPR